MSFKDRLRQEDQRLLGLLGAVAVGLCLDATVRLWPSNGPDDTPTQQPSEIRLATPRPSNEDLSTSLNLLLPLAPEASEDENTEPGTGFAIVEQDQEGLLAELFIDRHKYKLRACFASRNGMAFAAVERIDADSGARSLDRLQEADPLGPYTVESIDRRSLRLSAPDGRTIQLRLFELAPHPKAG